MRRFSLFMRGSIWYAQIKNPTTNQYMTARSTGQRNRDEAAAVVVDWLRNGLPDRPIAAAFDIDTALHILRTATPTEDDIRRIIETLTARGMIVSATVADSAGAELFGDFLCRFWAYDRSPYVVEKKSFGHSITKTHCKTNLGRAKLYWVPFFEGKHLSDITADSLKAFARHLDSIKPALAPVSKNHIFVLGKTALSWAFANKLISNDPTIGVPNFACVSRARGVLEPEEAKQLFLLPWKNERARLANLTAMCTGLRIMEVLSLKVEDFDERSIHVRRSYSRHDGFKGTKTNQERTIPIQGELAHLKTALLEHAKGNPWGNGLVFWSHKEDEPMGNQAALDGLKDALVLLRVGPNADENEKHVALAYWEERNITCHSWRHFYSSRIADRIAKRQVMLVTGHTTESVFNSYASHKLQKDFDEVGAAMSDVFGSILPFNTGKEEAEPDSKSEEVS